MSLKFGAYAMTGSIGLFSDAVESVVNLTAGVIALCAIIVSARPADEDHTFGHGKVEYFSGGVEGVLVLVAAAGIAMAAVRRFLSPVPLQSLGLGLAVAVTAGGVNFVVARIMLKAAKAHDSLVLEADARHLMTDVWTTAALVAGLSITLAAPSWSLLDPILGLIMAVNIMVTGAKLVWTAFQGLMDRGLEPGDLETIEGVIRALGPPFTFHGLRTRKAGRQRFVEFHLLVPGGMSVHDSHALCCRLEREFRRIWPQAHITIHVEPLENGGVCPVAEGENLPEQEK